MTPLSDSRGRVSNAPIAENREVRVYKMEGETFLILGNLFILAKTENKLTANEVLPNSDVYTSQDEHTTISGFL